MTTKTADQDFPRPEEITGGCLCGGVRYRIRFPAGHDFIKNSGTCQCTQCRRCTGSLFFSAQTVRTADLEFLTACDSLKHYNSTPGFSRSFCGKCGSFLFWKKDDEDAIDVAIGSVDPEFLFGEGTESEGFGFALANARGNNLWCENEIKGVTDKMIVGGNNFARARTTSG